MQRLFLSLAFAALATFALANPFVWPADWTVTPVGEAQYGGTIVQGSLSDPRTFHPVLQSETNEVTDMMQFADILTLSPSTGEYIPYAAESMTISDDGTVIDVVLRDNLRWSTGEPITVQDYFASYILMTDQETGSNKYDSWFQNDVQITLEITGERSMRYTFPGPDRNALFLLGTHFPVLDRIFGEAYRSGGADAVNALWGTETPVSELVFDGPFVLSSFQPGERLVWERNPYFGEWNVDEAGNSLPYLDGRTHRIADQDAQLNLFLAGELDLFGPRNLDDIGVINVAIQNGDIDAEVLEGVYPAGSSGFFVFNWNLSSNPFLQSVFRNVNVRQAMWHLVDRDTITELVYSGLAVPMHSSVYLTDPFWIDDDAITTYDYDPERALELLARAGFSQRDGAGYLVNADGQRISFTIATNAGNTQREQIVQIFVEDLQAVGIDASATALDFSLLVDQLLSTGEDRPFEGIYIGLTGGSAIWPFGESVVGCAGFLHMYNTSGDCLTPQETLMEQLMNLGRRTLDNEEARAIGLELQAIEAELAPVLYTVSPLLHVAFTSRVGGEFPLDVMSGRNTSRTIVLTHVQ
jgi:peptide/nickel transport system substrate-binding protein